MNKTSIEYSKSVKATFGDFYPKFGDFKSLKYIDNILVENEISFKCVNKIYKLFIRIEEDFAELSKYVK